MLVAPSFDELATEIDTNRICVAFGVFDGVHRGHQEILQNLLEMAADTDALPVVCTFEPHPDHVLSQKHHPELLTCTKHKLALFRQMGVKATVQLHFTQKMAQLPPRQFLDTHLLRSPLTLTGICVGSDWKFGARGEGDVHFLEREGSERNFRVVSVPSKTWHRKPIRSTHIREEISKGNLNTAERMLGRPYGVWGKVSAGKGIATPELSCPTANIETDFLILPPNGVYTASFSPPVTIEQYENRLVYNAVAYVGHAPTIENEQGKERVLECHAFDLAEDLYTSEALVFFHTFLRAEQHFPSISALKQQIQEDIHEARRHFTTPTT